MERDFMDKVERFN